MVGVFLSHSSKDKPFVRDLADALEAGGEIKVWLDEREIDYGQNIVLKIADGLDADFVLLILSPDSVDSKWVKEEWTDAYWEQVESQHVKVAGVLYRDCRIPRLLRNKKYFDLRTSQPEGFRLIKTWLLGQRPRVPPVVHLPQRPPLVIGREQEIEELRHRLREPGSVAHVVGLPGRGKSTLALEYAHRHQGDFEAVHWLPCQGRTLVQMAGELAWQLGLKLDGDLDFVLRQLNDHCASKRCLLVLDNVEDDTPVKLMPAGRSSVLITTRFINLPFLRFHKPLGLPLFTEEECLKLFREVIGKEGVERHEDEARLLFQRLGYLPIGISVAAALVREDVRYTIPGLAKNLPTDAYALLREAVAALSPGAQTLIAAMAVCAPEGFRVALAAEVAELDVASSLDALQEIHSRSLVEELDRVERRYRLHALVREAAAAPDSQRRKHGECVRKEFKGWETGRRQCEEDMADWGAALSWFLGQVGDDKAWSMANDLAYLGYSLTRRLGRLPEAQEICERMAQEAKAREDGWRLQGWYGNQALILELWGRLEEAMALFKKVEASNLELGNQQGLQRTYGHQGLILKAWGRLEEAMALHRKREAICLELGDQDGLQRTYGNQALIFRAWGRLDEAMALHRKQETICLELGNQEGLQQSYGNQAVILKDEGHLEEAMALHAKQEAIAQKLGNRDSLQRIYANQALILEAWGRLDEAMALIKRAEAICLELGDQDSLHIGYGNQASILRAWGRLDEAMALHRKQETICLELGNQEGLAHCYWDWGLLAREQHDSKTEKEKLEQALALFTELKMPHKIKAVQESLDETNPGD
jgi:tetratricopeptide (TPR) repeat protein